MAQNTRDKVNEMVAAWLSAAKEKLLEEAQILCEVYFDKAESEIEKLLSMALFLRIEQWHKCFGHPASQCYWYDQEDADPFGDYPIPEGDDWTEYTVICPQYKVAKYRADIAIRRTIRSIHNGQPLSTQIVLVECDGHDFHERTKEQAKRDKSRDRELQAMGFVVLRFTGSEIWRDAMGCAVQIDEFLDGQVNKLIAEHRKHRQAVVSGT